MQDKDREIFDKAHTLMGIYLHVPFCARICDFCAFYKTKPNFGDIENYLQNLKKEVDWRLDEGLTNTPIHTMFWGGGTPAMLSENHIEATAKIFEHVLPKYEWTIEAAPSSINKSKLKLFKDLGVTRISLGVQSFNKDTLDALGRPHSLSAALRAIDDIAETGFEKFSLDLIFSAPNQTHSDFEKDLLFASKTPVNHISAYCLEFESGTSCCGGKEKSIEQENKEADFVEQAMQTLPSLGFKQYEISNFAKEGFECIHNLITWNMGSWLGFGPSAASQFGGLRFRNPPSLQDWANTQNSSEKKFDDLVKLDDEELFSSALIFGLRLTNGVDLQSLSMRYQNADIKKYEAKLDHLSKEGFLEIIIKRNPCGYQIGKIIRLTPKGRMLADAVAVELLD